MNKNQLRGTPISMISIIENINPVDNAQLMYSSDWSQNVKIIP